MPLAIGGSLGNTGQAHNLNMKLKSITKLAAGMFLAGALSAQAEIYTFGAITANGVNSPGIGEAQLSVEVVAGDNAGQVKFIFRNSGPDASSITDVYFDDGTLLGIASVINGGLGVDFSQGASPGDLPSGNTVNFNATAGFTADSNPPAQPNGVNPGEELTIVFNLIGGQTLADVIDAIELSLASPGVDVDGGLRIGIHVQGFANGESETFVNEGPPDGTPPVPDAGSTVAMLGLALSALGFGARRIKA
jgi:hypothetical protein